MADLQNYVNTRGLADFNKYCFLVHPIHYSVGSMSSRPSVLQSPDVEASTDVIHPFIEELNKTITSSDSPLKNVDLLIEVEIACLRLGGCRVTFCKSGKDRTGIYIDYIITY